MAVQSSSRKWMFIGGGAIAAVALVIGFQNYPPQPKDSTGTIGAAQRYHEPQITEADVKVSQDELTTWLQSETFDRIVKDPEARRLFTNEAVMRTVTDEARNKVQLVDEARARVQIADDARVQLALAGDANARLQLADDARNKIQLADEARAKLALAGDANAKLQLADDARTKIQLADEARAKLELATDARTKLELAADARAKLQLADDARVMLALAGDARSKLQLADDARSKIQLADEARAKLALADGAAKVSALDNGLIRAALSSEAFCRVLANDALRNQLVAEARKLEAGGNID